MSSRNAAELGQRLAEILGRPLSKIETVRCEELTYFIYPRPARAILEAVAKMSKPSADAFFARAFNLPASARRHPEQISFLSTTKYAIYNRLSSFLGDGFSLAELDIVADISKNATLQEIQDAASIASNRGIYSAQYIKGIILNARRLKTRRRQMEAAIYKKVDMPGAVVPQTNVRISKDHWTRRVKDLQEDATFDQAIKKKTDIR